MSTIDRPSIFQTNQLYLPRILSYHGLVSECSANGDFLGIRGFDDYNYLVQLQALFMGNPTGNVIDRTESLTSPMRFYISRPWSLPTAKDIHLDDCMAQIVHDLQSKEQSLTLCWSGGIDSTAMVVAFIRHATDVTPVRILYTRSSIRENPDFFTWLDAKQPFQMVEYSGDQTVLATQTGLFVTGDGADDMTAYVDRALIESIGLSGLQQHWSLWCESQCNDPRWLEFCHWYFSLAGKPISSLLEARWWFFVNSNISETIAWNSDFLASQHKLVVGFYNNSTFEHYMFHNIDQIVTSDSFSSYKGFLKQYIFDFDHNRYYFDHKVKVADPQLMNFGRAQIAMDDLVYALLLCDGTRIRTRNMPLLSEREYRNTYGHSLDYLFNTCPSI